MRENIDKNLLKSWAEMDINFGKFLAKFYQLLDYFDANTGEYPTTQSDKRLHQWVKNIRQFYKRNTIEDRRIDLLNRVGFEWENRRKQKTFEERVSQVLAYKKLHGTMHVSQTARGIDQEEYSLSRWVNEMRRKYNENRLPMKYISKLNKVGFIWNIEDARFEKRVTALKRFYKTYGHFDVPQSGRTKKLGNWVASIRSRGVMTSRYRLWLDQIGFAWDGVRERKRKSLEKMEEVDMNSSLRKIRSKNKKPIV